LTISALALIQSTTALNNTSLFVREYILSSSDKDILSQTTIVGTQSGEVHFEVVIADKGHVAVLKNTRPFLPNEQITVSLPATFRGKSGLPIGSYSFTFKVLQTLSHDPLQSWGLHEVVNRNEAAYMSEVYEAERQVLTNTEQRSPDAFTIGINGTVSDGYWILDGGPGRIMRNDNTVFKGVVLGDGCYSLNAFDDWTLGMYSTNLDQGILRDTNLAIIDTFGVPGTQYNFHEFFLLPNGNGVLILTEDTPMDMSQYVTNGNPNGLLTVDKLQIVDPETNLSVFDWNPLDHYSVLESYWLSTAATTPSPYNHMNSASYTTDGNIITSGLAFKSINKINLTTGDVMWNMGGKSNQFTFLNDPYNFVDALHHATMLPNGNITLLDNGTNNQANHPTRAVEYSVDQTNMQATLVWSMVSPSGYHAALGTVQRLNNGRTYIHWGSIQTLPNKFITEVDSDNNIYFEVTSDNVSNFYRSFRNVWKPGFFDFTTTSVDVPENIGTYTGLVRLSPRSNCTIKVQVTGGSAQNSADYTFSPQTLSFIDATNSSYSRPFQVPIIDDLTDELNETITLKITDPTGGCYLRQDSIITLNIIDNDATKVGFGLTTLNVNEADGQIAIPVSTTIPTNCKATAYLVPSQTTASLSDYTLGSGILTFQNTGTTTQYLYGAPVNDNTQEPTEILTLALRVDSGQCVLDIDTITISIVDNDGASGSFYISNTNQTIDESAGQATVNIALSQPSDCNITLAVNTSQTTLLSNEYQLPTTTLQFSASGAATLPLQITINDDLLNENDENLVIDLLSADGGCTINPASTATITVTDNDKSFVTFPQNNITVIENDTTLQIPIAIDQLVNCDASISVAVAATTATNNADFILDTSTATFQQNSTNDTLWITVTINDDLLQESDEIITLTVNTTSGDCTTGSPAAVVIHIQDNETSSTTSPDLQKITLLPNPATSTITLQNIHNTIQQLTITNTLGQILFTDQNITTSTYTHPVQHLANGIYILTIQDNIGYRRIKFLKQ
jgi:hypothetical protein